MVAIYEPRLGMQGRITRPPSWSTSCVERAEALLRVLYYDAPEYHGRQRLPVSNEMKHFTGNDDFLKSLGQLQQFAIRRGILAWRDWKLRRTPVADRALTDKDFQPNLEQKGVDMRIGLDIANLATNRAADRIILVTGDTDMIPAMKHARISGLQIAVIQLPEPTKRIHRRLVEHSDIIREVAWPA